MGKVIKYKHKDLKRLFLGEERSINRWPDGSMMTIKESAERWPNEYEIIEENVITDQEREEIFDFAKELMRSAYLGGQSMSPDYAITKSSELYKLKDTI